MASTGGGSGSWSGGNALARSERYSSTGRTTQPGERDASLSGLRSCARVGIAGVNNSNASSDERTHLPVSLPRARRASTCLMFLTFDNFEIENVGDGISCRRNGLPDAMNYFLGKSRE